MLSPEQIERVANYVLNMPKVNHSVDNPEWLKCLIDNLESDPQLPLPFNDPECLDFLISYYG